ncbi:hypothetical protein NDA01_13800 [Trichocoleus desertorum AS-A10]|uniref:hypothetical protein n=1 Tax=Trichocoleus desertorum TaxID=1481672 RepID=UPI0032988BEA
MKLVKKIAAGILLPFGLAIVILTTADLLNKNSPTKEGSATILVLFGLPSLGLGSWFIWDLTQKSQAEKLDRLQDAFYQLVEANGGKITVLRFAKEADLSGAEAKQYLEEKAKEFNASYDVNEQGDITYRFTF